MTPDLRALENKLLLPLQRAVGDAARRLGMTLDPDRELLAGETPGDAAAVVAEVGSDAASLVQLASSKAFAQPYATPRGWPAPRAAQGFQPQAPAPREPRPLHVLAPQAPVTLGPAPSAPIMPPVIQTAPAEFMPGSPGPLGGRHLVVSSKPHQGAVEMPASRGARPDLAVAPGVHSRDAVPDASGASPVVTASGQPASRIAAGMPLSPTQAGPPGRSGEPLAVPQAMVLRFSTSGDNNAASSKLADQAEQPMFEAPPRTSSSIPLCTEPEHQPIQGLTTATTVRPSAVNVSATASMPSPAPEASAASANGSRAPTAPNLSITSGAQATAVPPDEPFGGLIPVRPLADTPSLGDRVAPGPTELPDPATASRFLAHPALGEVARAVQPFLSRAADVGEAAWDDEVLGTSTPSISNTFNITVAMAGSIGSVEREALQDALADLLRDAARRQGLDL